MKIPPHYSSLVLAEEWFATGLPMLMYHKLGPKPRGVRIQGLYVSTGAFRRQLTELAAAGYRSCSLDEVAAGTVGSAKRILLSFDDGYVSNLELGLKPLQDSGLQAIVYILAGKLGGTNDWDVSWGEASAQLMDAAQIREWLAGGQAIGSHSMQHVRLAEIPLTEAREQIGASKKLLEDRFGVPIRHFCYPYGSWNPAIRDLVMEAGYSTACTVEKGVNTASTHHHELLRVMARTPSVQDVIARQWRRIGA